MATASSSPVDKLLARYPRRIERQRDGGTVRTVSSGGTDAPASSVDRRPSSS